MCNPFIQKLFTTYHIFKPEIWSFYSNSESANIALPDSYATYFSSYVYLNNDEFLSIKGKVSDYEYYSLQVYDSRAITLGNINVLQSINGSIDLTITKNTNYVNNTLFNVSTQNIINVDSNNTIFLVIFRVYDLYETPINVKYLAPNLTITNSKIGQLTKAQSFVDLNYNWLSPNLNPVRFPKFSTTMNNFLKPALTSFFYNSDASYLLSNIQNPSRNLGIIINGILPEKKDLMYSSFNIGLSSPPMPTIAGKHWSNDSKLISSSGRAGIRHIEIEKRYQYDDKWNRNYTICIGLNFEHLRELGCDPNVDLYLLYPLQYFSMNPYSNIVILYRHLMPHPDFQHAIFDIAESHADPYLCANYMQKYYPLISIVITNSS